MFEAFLLFLTTYQSIIVNSTSPCFLNFTAGADLWRNCHADTDYLTFAMSGWQWVTGGWFSMILVAVFVVISYIKYQKVVYPILVGIFFLPISYFLFPSQFITFAVIMAFIGIGLIVAWVFISQTNES